MSSLVSPAEVRVLVKNGLSDVELQAVIDRVEAEITELIGVPQDESNTVEITETILGDGDGDSLFLPQPIYSVTSITDEDAETVDSDDYRVFAKEGRIEAVAPFAFLDEVYTVVYKPLNQNSKRKRVTIELVRLDLSRSAMKSENIAGEYQFSAPDWKLERNRLLKELTFQVI
jgi:hypothetical protein